MNRNKRRYMRNTMFQRDPHCRECGVELVKPEGFMYLDNQGFQRLKNPPDNMAVVFSLDSRLSKERGRHPGEYRHTLLCKKCAHRRNAAEQTQVPLEELHERASGEWVNPRATKQFHASRSIEENAGRWEKMAFYSREMAGIKYSIEEARLLGQQVWNCYANGTLIRTEQYLDAAMEACEDEARLAAKQHVRPHKHSIIEQPA